MNKNKSLILLIICGVIFVLSLIGFTGSFSESPYIEENSVVYNLNEENEITKVEITIKNPTLKVVDGEDILLKYCREDRYPEGYASPIVFSLKPLESKTIEITNFRNTWVYNQNYHIEASRIDIETNIPITIQNHGMQYFWIMANIIILPLSLAGIITGIVQLIKNKEEKTEENK